MTKNASRSTHFVHPIIGVEPYNNNALCCGTICSKYYDIHKGLKDGMTHQANTNLEIGHNCLLWQPVMLCLRIMVPAHFHDVTDDKIW